VNKLQLIEETIKKIEDYFMEKDNGLLIEAISLLETLKKEFTYDLR
jgi:hypothetical protein